MISLFLKKLFPWTKVQALEVTQQNSCGSAVMAFACFLRKLWFMCLSQKPSPFSKHLQSFLMPASTEPRESVTDVGFVFRLPQPLVAGEDRDLQMLWDKFSIFGILLLNLLRGYCHNLKLNLVCWFQCTNYLRCCHVAFAPRSLWLLPTGEARWSLRPLSLSSCLELG